MPGGPADHRHPPTAPSTLAEALVEVWRQLLVEGAPALELGGQRRSVERTRSLGLRTVAFEFRGSVLEAIEQNPTTSSRWAKLAQEGKRILQFRSRGRYVANVCEGTLLRYPAWKAQQLPE